MVRVVISMAAVKTDGGWKSELYCYEEDEGDGVRLANEATCAIRQALEQGAADGGRVFEMGRPPSDAIPLWDVWIGVEKRSRTLWAEECDYRRHPGCPQSLVPKMMEAYRILRADCGGGKAKRKGKGGSRGRLTGKSLRTTSGNAPPRDNAG